jgi:hypothetical protein
MFRRFFLAACLSVLSASSSLALTLAADPFTFLITASGLPDRSATGTGGVNLSADMGEGTAGEVTFVDADTIDIAFFGGFDVNDAFDLVTSLSGLNFSMNGLSTPITGVTFNRAGSNIDEFIGDVANGQPALSDFVIPVLALTATSFEAQFSFFHHGLLGDGPRLRYDLSFGTPVSTVPLPASLPFLISGLAGLSGLRLRKKRETRV